MDTAFAETGFPMGQRVPHPDEKPEEVHLKGRYAIFPDGKVLLNNPSINKLKECTFADTLPEWHKAQIAGAAERERRMEEALKRAMAEQEMREKLLRDGLVAQVAQDTAAARAQVSPDEEQYRSYKTVIEGARTVTQIRAIMDSLGIKIKASMPEEAKTEAVEALRQKFNQAG